MSVIYKTTQVYYRIVESRKCVGGKEIIVYGVEGSNGEDILHIASLSYDLERINNLIDILNESQIALESLQKVVGCFLKENYGIEV